MEWLVILLTAAAVFALLRRSPSAPPSLGGTPAAGDRAWVAEEFARRRTRQQRMWVPVLAVSAVAIWMKHATVRPAVALLFFAVALPVVAATLVVTWRNWRCPACNRHLGKRANPLVCPFCGARLA